MAAQGFPIADVVRTRLVLARAVAVDFAADLSRDTFAAHGILDAMDTDDLAPAEFLALDARLHLALVEASGNAVIAAMMTGLRDAIESYVMQGSERIAGWTAMDGALRVEHRAILAAIDAGDGTAASDLLRDHRRIPRHHRRLRPPRNEIRPPMTSRTPPRRSVARQLPDPRENFELMKFKARSSTAPSAASRRPSRSPTCGPSHSQGRVRLHRRRGRGRAVARPCPADVRGRRVPSPAHPTSTRRRRSWTAPAPGPSASRPPGSPCSCRPRRVRRSGSRRGCGHTVYALHARDDVDRGRQGHQLRRAQLVPAVRHARP